MNILNVIWLARALTQMEISLRVHFSLCLHSCMDTIPIEVYEVISILFQMGILFTFGMIITFIFFCYLDEILSMLGEGTFAKCLECYDRYVKF